LGRMCNARQTGRPHDGVKFNGGKEFESEPSEPSELSKELWSRSLRAPANLHHITGAESESSLRQRLAFRERTCNFFGCTRPGARARRRAGYDAEQR
jgi:hypothetical protein